MNIAAYVLSCPERQAVLANSLASLKASDWGEEPVIIENRDTDPDRRMRIQNGARAVLEQALSSGADFVLYLEDDVMFNRYLRHNLTRWAPLASARAEAPFFATLFRPPGVPASGTQAIANAADFPATCSYGNQALVLSRATVRYQLDHWSEESLEADHKLARLAGRLGPLWVHSPSLVQHLGGKSTWGGAFLQTADFAPLWKAGEDETYDGPLTSAGVLGALRSCIERLPPCPSDLADTGIVIAAGGLHYLVNAWVCVRVLRRHGCALPIEVWHLGPEEMPPVFSRLLAAQGVECIDAHRRLADLPVRQLRGWALKPYAVLASRFRHVLLLDADNVPARDPSFLFETPEYGRSGAIFWPDRSDRPGLPGAFLRANHPAWRLTGLEHRGDPSFESGQACIDKARCWRALSLALWMNEHADFWYQFVYGDKDTFHLAWRMLGRALGDARQGAAHPRRFRIPAGRLPGADAVPAPSRRQVAPGRRQPEDSRLPGRGLVPRGHQDAARGPVRRAEHRRHASPAAHRPGPLAVVAPGPPAGGACVSRHGLGGCRRRQGRPAVADRTRRRHTAGG